MATLIPVRGVHPQLPALLAPNATLVGDVRFGPGCSVWFATVLRGDLQPIILGERCNVQDGCVIHVSRQRGCLLGREVSMGHGAIVHACEIGEGVLVGLGSRVLDGARIGAGSLIAAGCVVPEGMEVPPGHLVAGVPGRLQGPLRAETAARIARIAGDYVAYQELYPDLLTARDPASPAP
jgi:carbonic anhydrase/acetyltransferase-like protein (isoleucine patch superfamily)